ncbi:unnamed protein product, partial [Symbiodinium pilosum]
VQAIHQMCPGVYGYSYDDGMGLITCDATSTYMFTVGCPGKKLDEATPERSNRTRKEHVYDIPRAHIASAMRGHNSSTKKPAPAEKQSLKEAGKNVSKVKVAAKNHTEEKPEKKPSEQKLQQGKSKEETLLESKPTDEKRPTNKSSAGRLVEENKTEEKPSEDKHSSDKHAEEMKAREGTQPKETGAKDEDANIHHYLDPCFGVLLS